jgi:hypothetical protein
MKRICHITCYVHFLSELCKDRWIAQTLTHTKVYEILLIFDLVVFKAPDINTRMIHINHFKQVSGILFLASAHTQSAVLKNEQVAVIVN